MGRCTAASLALLALSLVGCRGTPPESEIAARATLADTAARYRPEGRLPDLPALTEDSPPEDYARYAAYRNHRVEELFHRWAQTVEEITVVRSRPDPTVALEMELGDMIGSVMPGITQEFPAYGKLVLAAEAQSHVAAARRWEFEQAVVAVATEVWRSYLEAALLQETVRINRDILGVVLEFEELAAAQIRVGKVTEQDLLRIQIERDQIENEIASLEDNRSVLGARLRQALGIPAAEPDPPLPRALAAVYGDLPDEDLLAAAFAARRDLRLAGEELQEAAALVELARTTGQPDFMTGLRVNVIRPISGTPELGITLPVWRDKIEAAIAGATAGHRAAGSRQEEARLTTVALLAEALFQFRDAGRRLKLLGEKLLPKASAALEVARSSYPTGQTDLTSLLDAERSLLMFRQEEVRAKAERGTAWAQIMFEVIGRRPPGAAFYGAEEEQP